MLNQRFKKVKIEIQNTFFQGSSQRLYRNTMQKTGIDHSHHALVLSALGFIFLSHLILPYNLFALGAIRGTDERLNSYFFKMTFNVRNTTSSYNS